MSKATTETHAAVLEEQAFTEERRAHTVKAEPHVFPACRFHRVLAFRFRRGDHDEMRRCPPALNKLRKVFESVGTSRHSCSTNDQTTSSRELASTAQAQAS
jgi:hypothetical protein